MILAPFLPLLCHKLFANIYSYRSTYVLAAWIFVFLLLFSPLSRGAFGFLGRHFIAVAGFVFRSCYGGIAGCLLLFLHNVIPVPAYGRLKWVRTRLMYIFFSQWPCLLLVGGVEDALDLLVHT